MLQIVVEVDLSNNNPPRWVFPPTDPDVIPCLKTQQASEWKYNFPPIQDPESQDFSAIYTFQPTVFENFATIQSSGQSLFTLKLIRNAFQPSDGTYKINFQMIDMF